MNKEKELFEQIASRFIGQFNRRGATYTNGWKYEDAHIQMSWLVWQARAGIAPDTEMYIHKRRMSEYAFIGEARFQTDDWVKLGWTIGSGEGEYISVDMEPVSVYRDINDNSLWVRPLDEFNDGRFEKLG